MAQRDDPDFRSTLVQTAPTLGSPVASGGGDSACLVIIYGDELGKRIELARSAIGIGRGVDCEIALEDEASSRRHAQVAWAGSSYKVTDLGSTNGTYVNDVQVKEAELRDGDQIKVGRTIFKFIFGSNVELSYHEEIYRMMTFDGLTRAFNKRSFEEAFDREISRSRRYRRPISIVIFDIDFFKKVNDTFGHVAGDAVLRQVAALVAQRIRRDDILARVGGEEFALLLPEIHLAAARTVAEKLRAAIEQTEFTFEGKRIPVTCSFGAAELALEGQPVMSPTEMYKAADAKLYEAKRSGRNRVC